MKQAIIISCILIIPILSLTKLTISNCPEGFNVTNYNTSLDNTNSEIAKILYSSIFSNSPLESKIKAGDL